MATELSEDLSEEEEEEEEEKEEEEEDTEELRSNAAQSPADESQPSTAHRCTMICGPESVKTDTMMLAPSPRRRCFLYSIVSFKKRGT